MAGGRVLVVLPDEVAADVRGRVGVGSLDLLGHVDTGAQVDSTVTEPAAKPPAKGVAPTVKLDLLAGFGVIEVRRASDPRPLPRGRAVRRDLPERPPAASPRQTPRPHHDLPEAPRCPPPPAPPGSASEAPPRPTSTPSPWSSASPSPASACCS